jgi:hypothetical protein
VVKNEMMTFDEFAEENPTSLVLDEFKAAIVGYGERINLGPVVVYDKDMIIEMLMKEMIIMEDDLYDGQTEEDKKYEMAIEYFDFNIIGAWMGEYTPIYLTKFEK